MTVKYLHLCILDLEQALNSQMAEHPPVPGLVGTLLRALLVVEADHDDPLVLTHLLAKAVHPHLHHTHAHQ